MSDGNQPGKSGLGGRLQGVQHFGVTVHDMDKSMEFYTEVLGGQLAVHGDAFTGEVLQNTLFQKEEMEAEERKLDPRSLGVPNCRDGSREVLDVRFISFGNTAVELIHFRDAHQSPSAPNVMEKVSTCVGYGNVMHLSFHVKDDVDLNQFARELEEECTQRGINLVCNRVVHVRSEKERREVALKYTANKFWNDPEYFIEGYSDLNFGDFHGWSLFYAKGPNGEQLEFNQVTRDIRDKFIAAQQSYNAANGTSFAWPNTRKIAPVAEQGRLPMDKTTWDWPHTKKWPRFSGPLIDIAKKMFLAGESMNVENFVKFYTDDALYQFSNFPTVYGPEGIRKSSGSFEEKGSFLGTVEGVNHHIVNIWEVAADSLVVQMEVTYTRHNGKVFTLPCCDVVRFRGDKICELRIFMDITPVMNTEGA